MKHLSFYTKTSTSNADDVEVFVEASLDAGVMEIDRVHNYETDTDIEDELSESEIQSFIDKAWDYYYDNY